MVAAVGIGKGSPELVAIHNELSTLQLPLPAQWFLERFGSHSLRDPMFLLVGWPWMFYRQMRRDKAFIRAGGMAYATLIALVPMLVLIYAVLGATGVVAQNPEAVSDLLFGTFLGQVPELQDTLLPGLREVNLGTLSVTGLVMLFFVAARLFLMVERAYCDIFNTPNTRKFSYRLLNFYFTLTAVPVVLGFTILGSVEFATGYDLLWVGDVTTSFLQFIVLLAAIRLFPCTYVRWGPATTGAMTAWLLLEIGGRGFSAYVLWFASDDPLRLVYGALWIIPIFLLWLYLLWLCILLGVEVAAVIQNYDALIDNAVRELHREGRLLHDGHALDAVGRIAHRFLQEQGPSPIEWLAGQTGLSIRDTYTICRIMNAAGLLVQTDQGWLPSRPPPQITTAQIVHAWRDGAHLPSGHAAPTNEVTAVIDRSLDEDLARAVQRWYSPN